MMLKKIKIDFDTTYYNQITVPAGSRIIDVGAPLFFGSAWLMVLISESHKTEQLHYVVCRERDVLPADAGEYIGRLGDFYFFNINKGWKATP